jgi:hypothetical protein
MSSTSEKRHGRHLASWLRAAVTITVAALTAAPVAAQFVYVPTQTFFKLDMYNTTAGVPNSIGSVTDTHAGVPDSPLFAVGDPPASTCSRPGFTA